MKMLLTAIALTIALPAVAHAQAAPASAAKADSHEKMMAECKAMMAKMGHDMHDMKGGMNMSACHDMAQPAAKTPPADPHQTHKM